MAREAADPAVSPEVTGENTANTMQALLGAQLRPVPVSPGLMVYLDQVKRARLIALERCCARNGVGRSPISARRVVSGQLYRIGLHRVYCRPVSSALPGYPGFVLNIHTPKLVRRAYYSFNPPGSY